MIYLCICEFCVYGQWFYTSYSSDVLFRSSLGTGLYSFESGSFFTSSQGVFSLPLLSLGI